MVFMKGLLLVVLLITALFMIVLILIQRGKGGGLAGAFGGMGGQSAFGTKAGDLFTKITIGVATFWIVLCMIAVKVFGVGGESQLSSSLGGSAPEQKPGISAPAPKEKGTEGSNKPVAPAPAEKKSAK